MEPTAQLEFVDNLTNWLINKGINAEIAHYFRVLVMLIILAIVIYVVNVIAKRVIIKYVNRLVSMTKNKWDDGLANENVFERLSELIPILIAIWAIPVILKDFKFLIPFTLKIIDLYTIWTLMQVLLSVISALRHYFMNETKFKDKPIDSYFQVLQLVAYFIGGVFFLSVIINEEPAVVLGTFGAISAVLLLVFKDTILGFVASIQISANDTLRVNDWLEMSKYGADGVVTAITLNTVKVKNWDNTITTIPTYALVSDSFKNWRSMQDSGARRIKRHIFIRPNSVQFLTQEKLIDLNDLSLITPFLSERQAEIEQHNTKVSANKTELANGRNMTNLGVFRKYAELYLRCNLNVSRDHTLMVRQLQPNQYGIPVEVYCFANTVVWTEYESIQSDIMDHLLAVASRFNLKVYELQVND